MLSKRTRTFIENAMSYLPALLAAEGRVLLAKDNEACARHKDGVRSHQSSQKRQTETLPRGFNLDEMTDGMK